MTENRLCKAITSRGTRCKARALEGQEWCYNHSPHSAEQRREHASAGGKSRSRQVTEVSRIEAIDKQLKRVTQDVIEGRLSEDVARVAIQGLNARLRAAKVKQETVEFEEYGRRLEALEQKAKAQQLGRNPRRGA